MAKAERNAIMTPAFRGSFMHLVTAVAVSDDNPDKKVFQATAPFPKGVPENIKFLQQLQRLIQDASAAAHGAPGLSPGMLKHYPIVDADKDQTKSQYENLRGCLVVTMSTKFKPSAIGLDGTELLTDDQLYSGAWYRAMVSCYGWDHKTGGKGVSVTLESIIKVKEDARFGGGANARDDFAALISAAPATAGGIDLGNGPGAAAVEDDITRMLGL